MKTSKHRTTPLTQTEIEEFFNSHLPYRQAMLTTHKLITKDKPQYQREISKDIVHKLNICGVEASIIACRMFIEFLGLGIKYSPLHLVQRRDYFTAEDGNSYEVKVIDLGGRWIEINSLIEVEKDLLARMYLTGHRSTAHLTYNAPYGGQWEIIHNGIELVSRLLKSHLYDIVGKEIKTQ